MSYKRFGKNIQDSLDALRKRFSVTNTVTQRNKQSLVSQGNSEKIKAGYKEYAESRKVKESKPEPFTPSKAEGSDRKRKTSRVYQGPKIVTKTSVKAGVTTGPIQPVRSALTKPSNTITDLADSLYKEANFPSKNELNEAVKKYGFSKARNTMFKPKTLTELKARAGLGLIEPVIGSVEDYTLGLSLSSSKSRPATSQLRLMGAIVTPSALDYAVGYGINKLLKTSTGRKVVAKLGEYKKGVELKLTPREEREFKKIIWNIDDLKGKSPTEFTEEYLDTFEKIANYYKKNPKTPRTAILDLEFNKPQYDRFIEKYALKLNLPTSIITAYLMRLSPREQAEYLSENTKLTTTQINNAIEQLREVNKQESSLGVSSSLISEPVVVPVNIPELVPPVEVPIEEGKPPVEKPVEVPVLIPPVEVPIEEGKPPVETPPIRLSLSDKEKRRGLALRIYAGPKSKWIVVYDGKESHVVEARGVIDALTKAERSRRGRSANLIQVRKVS